MQKVLSSVGMDSDKGKYFLLSGLSFNKNNKGGTVKMAWQSAGDWSTATTNYTYQVPFVYKEDTDEVADFKSLIAFKGLKIIEAKEINGCIHLKCKRGNRVFNIETNATYAEMFNSKKESIIQIGLRFIKSFFETPITYPNYTTTTNATTDYIWNSTAGGSTTLC